MTNDIPPPQRTAMQSFVDKETADLLLAARAKLHRVLDAVVGPRPVVAHPGATPRH